MNLSLISPLVVTVSALALALLERAYPYTPSQPFFRKGFWMDLALYAILQSYVLSWIIFGFAYWLDGITGASKSGVVGGWPVWVQLMFFLFTHDLYIYLFHRWQHRNKYLYRIHEAHHSVADVDWLAGARSHSLEILVNQTVEFTPIVLLGAAPEIVVLKGMLDAVWGMYIHSNVDVHSGWLQHVLNGPEMHRWHHAKGKGNSINYATKLAVWDWLFGTAYLPSGARPVSYGLPSPNFPDGYLAQHLYAFRRFGTRRGYTSPKNVSKQAMQMERAIND